MVNNNLNNNLLTTDNIETTFLILIVFMFIRIIISFKNDNIY